MRRLLLSGDNILKNRDDDGRWDRARERYREADRLARAAGLSDVVPLIAVRLEDVGAEPG